MDFSAARTGAPGKVDPDRDGLFCSNEDTPVSAIRTCVWEGSKKSPNVSDGRLDGKIRTIGVNFHGKPTHLANAVSLCDEKYNDFYNSVKSSLSIPGVLETSVDNATQADVKDFKFDDGFYAGTIHYAFFKVEMPNGSPTIGSCLIQLNSYFIEKW
jgi:hypothetical protein